MSKIDEMPDYRAKLPSHVHDLSHDFGFTATTAHLLPVFHDYLNAGETVDLSFNYFLRTQPLQSAAMTKLKTHTEYFFVPMQLLYQPFGSFLYGVTDEYSSNFAATIPDNLPIFDMDSFLQEYGGYADGENGAQRDCYVQNGVSIGECNGLLIYRLADMFGFDPTSLMTGATRTEHVNPNVFPYQYLAYNCIYEYYYRLDNREAFKNHLFNVDKFYNRVAAIYPTDVAEPRYMFSIKYRPLGNDYFTDCKVSPIVDVLNLNNKTTLSLAQNWLSRRERSTDPVLKSGFVGSSSTSPQGLPFTPSNTIQTNFGFSAVGISSPYLNGTDINTANIRAMFASEKLWSITGRAKKHYDDQVLAHLGFEVPHDPKHQITCFGHDIGDISIGEVISTSNTYNSETDTGSPLAEIAGKGYGSSNNKSHKFKAPCHGVVMVIFSVVADRNYFQGVPKYNVMVDRNDLYQPEYDHLGMQPIFGYEVGDYLLANHADIYGWQYRYEQWKRRYNRVTGAFSNREVAYPGSFMSWFNISYQNITDSFNGPNANSFVNFLNLPTDINDIMLLYYDNMWRGVGDPYSNDPFIVSSHISCKKISTMSDYSLPRLDA